MKYLKSGNINRYSSSNQGFTINPFGRISTNSTNSLKIPTGLESQRPGSEVLSNGLIRYNTSADVLEVYMGVGAEEGPRWEPLKKLPERVITKQTIPGDFNEPYYGPLEVLPANIDNLFVFVDNIYQRSTENFTLVLNPSGLSPTRENQPYPAGVYIQFTGNENVPTGIDVTVLFGFED
jgi:hypothetical protein